MLGGWPGSRGLFSNFATSGYSYICNVASNNDNGPIAALERPPPLLYAQRLSMWKALTTLKRVEVLSPVIFRTSLEGRSTRQRREGVVRALSEA